MRKVGIMVAGVKELEARGASYFKMRCLDILVEQGNDQYLKS